MYSVSNNISGIIMIIMIISFQPIIQISGKNYPYYSHSFLKLILLVISATHFLIPNDLHNSRFLSTFANINR